jgi:hypothetical protein
VCLLPSFWLRRFDLSRIDPLSDEFGKLLESFVGFEYPVLDALANTTKWLANWPEMKRRIMAKATRQEVVQSWRLLLGADRSRV